ncbi:MAG: hypothetical protein ABI432_15650 [Flavobacteriales bacterium]
MLSLRTGRSLALALCLLLGWTMVQRGLLHRCVHATHRAQEAPTVQAQCPVCDTMLPVFNAAACADPVACPVLAGAVGTPLVSAERFGRASLLPGRGPPSLFL